MSPKQIRANLLLNGIDFDETEDVCIRKIIWPRSGPTRVILWMVCHHPVASGLASSLLPYMDVCVCWYHDHDAMSCLRVESAMGVLQMYNSNTCLLATVIPRASSVHKSNIHKYYDELGFERVRFTSGLNESIELLIRRHLKYKRDVKNN